MGKRKDLIRSYEQFKLNSFYGIGQRKAKLFMNARIKELNRLQETVIGTEQQTILMEMAHYILEPPPTILTDTNNRTFYKINIIIK